MNKCKDENDRKQGTDLLQRALKARLDIAQRVDAKQITPEDRRKLNGFVSTIMEKRGFDPDGFTAEIRRAMSGRLSVA